MKRRVTHNVIHTCIPHNTLQSSFSNNYSSSSSLTMFLSSYSTYIKIRLFHFYFIFSWLVGIIFCFFFLLFIEEWPAHYIYKLLISKETKKKNVLSIHSMEIPFNHIHINFKLTFISNNNNNDNTYFSSLPNALNTIKKYICTGCSIIKNRNKKKRTVTYGYSFKCFTFNFICQIKLIVNAVCYCFFPL